MLQFYNRPVLLDRNAHRELRLGAQVDYCFASRTNSVFLVGEEFEAASRSYPIVFTRVGPEQHFPVVLVGVRNAENLFVDQAGGWEAGRYVPAFVRRYPFVLTDQGDVCFDEAAANIGGAGSRLLEVDGEVAPALKQTLGFLAAFQRGVESTQAFMERLARLGLLTDWSIEAATTTGEAYRIDGLQVVDRQRLCSLSDADTLALCRSGEMAWLHAHLASLEGVADLVAHLDAAAEAA